MRYLRYTGKEDLTQWVARINLDDPLIYPYWPVDKEHVAIFLEDDDGTLRIGVTTDADDLFQHRLPGRLWFCNFPTEDLSDATDFEPQNPTG